MSEPFERRTESSTCEREKAARRAAVACAVSLESARSLSSPTVFADDVRMTSRWTEAASTMGGRATAIMPLLLGVLLAICGVSGSMLPDLDREVCVRLFSFLIRLIVVSTMI